MNFHNFKVNDIKGSEFDLGTLKGKKVLLVNTASACGYTPQFGQLEELYKAYGDDSFTILGFPSNDFGAQDPGSAEEIESFCQLNYGVSFPMMAKVKIVGENPEPLFAWLQEKAGMQIKWNFFKFLIDENGEVVKAFPSGTLPIDEEIVSWIAQSK